MPDTDPTTQTIERTAPAIRDDTAVLRLGYVPLTDAAPLLVAEHKGFFARHGLKVTLSRLASWAAIRDHVLFGRLDGAQMLSPMPLAANLSAAGDAAGALSVVATLGLNGNTITLGDALLRDIRAAAPELADQFPLPATALAAALALRRAAGRPPPAFAVVFPYSSHNYLLRYWLASAGIDADREVRLTVVPPPFVTDYLAEGVIEGFCAGEPWGSRAVDLRAGQIVLTSADIWRNHPEKVLAIPGRVIAAAPERVVACLAALMQAGRWLDVAEHQEEAAALLCAHGLPDMPENLVLPALHGRIQLAPDTAPVATAPMLFHTHAASFPFRSHGAWWMGQMRRWGHLPDPADQPDVWRTDLWRRAATMLGEPQPLADSKQEGGHTQPWHLPTRHGRLEMAADPFIDGALFPAAEA